eukprot:Tbor_TRINITY_DN4171_c0_g1::TRINITY_DN4171_c0_g1_i1::g.26519::m.26519/K02259/COX15; cytochrome c oxidase assembly protein subunit 15
MMRRLIPSTRTNVTSRVFSKSNWTSSSGKVFGGVSTSNMYTSCPVTSLDFRHHTTAATDVNSHGVAVDDIKYILNTRNRTVSYWLYACSAMVGGVLVVGGMTRLTGSGLSIVDWRPVTGVIPPMNELQWEEEFTKYQTSPEFKQNPDMTIDQFKTIFYWEWGHRILARSVGVVYGIPLLYFLSKGYFKGQSRLKGHLIGFLALGGAQGAMGWYMVKSGLDNNLLDENKKVRVSAYRLAAHLALAFSLYAGMTKIGMSLVLPPALKWKGKYQFQQMARLSTAVMFMTSLSGAFVAGLHGGVFYCFEFPYMSGGVFPPTEDLLVYNPAWRNIFENPVAAQAWHRVMAGTTSCIILATNVVAWRVRRVMPVHVMRALWMVNAALCIQVFLGIRTIMTSVNTHVAISHQANSLILLTALLRLCALMGSKGTILL